MLFMNTSYWRTVEREMQTVPNFKPRRSGFRVNGVTLDRFRGYKNAAAKLLYRWKRSDVTERIAAMYRKSGSFFADSDHKDFFVNFIKITNTAADHMLPFFFCPPILVCGNVRKTL